MVTLYCPAWFNDPRADSYKGLSADIKPLDVPNGSVYIAIDTGNEIFARLP